jgi:hypothetical protein
LLPEPKPPPPGRRAQVVNAKAGAGSATLSMAYAAARMAESTLLGLAGEPSVFEVALGVSVGRGRPGAGALGRLLCGRRATWPPLGRAVPCPQQRRLPAPRPAHAPQRHACPDTPPTPSPQVVPGCPFFASKVQLGPDGVAQVLGLGTLNDFERRALDAMLPELKDQIQKVGEAGPCQCALGMGA